MTKIIPKLTIHVDTHTSKKNHMLTHSVVPTLPCNTNFLYILLALS